MSHTTPGILAIFNNVTPGREAEFEEWFQHEHLQERLSVPGFLLGRRYEAVAGEPRYFNFYVTRSVEVLSSPEYVTRINQPTPMTRMVMSEIFKDMIRTVCHQSFRLGNMRGSVAVTAQFSQPARPNWAQSPDWKTYCRTRRSLAGRSGLLRAPMEVRCLQEERLRGGDRRMEGCLLVETLRVQNAERIAAALSNEFPIAAIGVYQLLCEINL